MGDSSSKPADTFQFLRMEKLGLQLPMLGDVLGNSGDSYYGATFIENGKCFVANPTNRSVGAQDPVFFVVGAFDLLRQCRRNPFTIIFMNSAEPRERSRK